MKLDLLGGITAQQFLDDYWQQRPLLVRQAIPNIDAPFSPEELAGLTCDTETSSRLILEHGETPWQVKHAPFTEDDFTRLPESHWTLLINDLEHYYPELQNILQKFRFLPDWRIDDLMVSYAADQGTVGPHLDEYDVFLIQLAGKRRWQLDSQANIERLVPDISLKILEQFNAENDWVLAPGDMLYLPPNLAHYGVAQGDCMTYSVGFRAPDREVLLSAWLDEFNEHPELNQRYGDAKRQVQASPSEVSQHDIQHLKALMKNMLDEDSRLFEAFLGRHLSESAPSLYHLHDEHSAFDEFTDYIKNPTKRLTWIEHENGLDVFIDGTALSLPKPHKEALVVLTEAVEYSAQTLSELMHADPIYLELMELLLSHGFFIAADFE